MKKTLISVAALLLFTIGGFAQPTHDIRDVNWGWPISKVKSAEKFKLVNETADGLPMRENYILGRLICCIGLLTTSL